MVRTLSLREEQILWNTVSNLLAKSHLRLNGELTIIGTQVAFNTAKIIYVLQPILRIAGGVM